MADTEIASLTEYEKQRLLNVRKNEALLAALGVQNAASEMKHSPKKQAAKGYKRKAEKTPSREAPLVTRRLRSSRVSWGDVGQLQSEDAHGLQSNDLVVEEDALDSRVKYRETALACKNPLSLEDAYIQGDTASHLLDIIHTLEDEAPLCNLYKSVRSSKKLSTLPSLRLSLNEDDVARVVPGRIFAIEFLPVYDRLVLLAGDKGGHVGFWDVDFHETEGAGVHIFQPHESPVSGISIATFSTTKVFTCSYDGSIRQMDTGKAMFDVFYHTEDCEIISAMSFVPDAVNALWVAEGKGRLVMLDTRDKRPGMRFDQLHERRINTIDFNICSTWLMLTSSSDGSACIWDVRSMKNAASHISKLRHKLAVNSAYFSTSGNSLATCSIDDQIGIVRNIQHLDEKPQRMTTTMIRHPNKNNRWISSFRAIWGWDDERVYVASMERTIDIVSTSEQRTSHALRSPSMTSIPCRLAAHPLRCGILAGGSAGGKVFVWRQCDY